jgi:hypothetical protein
VGLTLLLVQLAGLGVCLVAEARRAAVAAVAVEAKRPKRLAMRYSTQRQAQPFLSQLTATQFYTLNNL